MMGYNPRGIPAVTIKSDVPTVEERMSTLQKAQEEAKAAHQLARQYMSKRVT